jgi:hypothetical protein
MVQAAEGYQEFVQVSDPYQQRPAKNDLQIVGA